MKRVTPKDKFPKSYSKSIFLAGPSLRNSDKDITPWREEACEILNKKGYDGVVFIPEPFLGGYEEQIKWENDALNRADCVLFWIPRSKNLPGFTTNIEYGEWMKSGKVVLGFPPDAERVDYLESKAKQNFIPMSSKLSDTVQDALSFIGDGALREDGETFVPSYVWNTECFKVWYGNLKKAGNRLDGAKVEWSFRVGPDKKIVFAWILFVDVYIAAEKRNKINEFVISRGDISVAAALYTPKHGPLSDSKIVFVKEFRSPVSNDDGYVHELPGGSSKKKEDMKTVVAHEFEEEVGVQIKPDRFNFIGTRQLCSTLSAHRAHMFVVKITEVEIEKITKNLDKVRGVEEDTERTYTEVFSIKNILKNENIDWSMIGMVLSAALIPDKDSTDSIGSFF